jgi:protein STE50
MIAAEAGPEAPPTQDDLARVIRIIKDRDERQHTVEAELKRLNEELTRMQEENRKLREEILPLARMAKESQPLPTPGTREEGHITSPPLDQRAGTGLSRKFSTKKLFLGSAPKNPSPTMHNDRTLIDGTNLDPSAAAMAASTNLTASMTGGHGASSPHGIPQPSPTSPAYSQQGVSRSYQRGDSSRAHDDHTYSTWSQATTINDREPRGTTPGPMSARPDPPLSGNSTLSSSASTLAAAPTSAPSQSSQTSSSSGSQNPQVEIFKSFRVSIDDPCHKVLPVALKKYNITADWRQYALYIVHGDQERCLGLNERPLILFKQLDKEGRKPMFMLRKHAAPQEGHVNVLSQPVGSNPGGQSVGIGGTYAGGGAGGGGSSSGGTMSGGTLGGDGTGSFRPGAVQLPGGVL